LFGRGKQHAEDEHEQENYRPQPASVSPESVAFETVIGPGASFRGNLSSPGSVRIEGTFVGDLELDGNILIGEHARITADINAANVTIAGAVRGNISGERVQLLRTGRVWGDIQSSSISTEDGAFIRGTITMRGGDIPPIFAEMAAETGEDAEAGVPEPGEEEAEVSEPDVPDDDDPFAQLGTFVSGDPHE
jgi:cytoskeletal protein CcmA (bactofilin family)